LKSKPVSTGFVVFRAVNRSHRQTNIAIYLANIGSFVCMTATTSLWWLYLLACKDGRTYVGIAVDVEARFKSHSEGKGAKFTRANPPISVLGKQPFATRSDASKAEYMLKQLDRDARLAWARLHHWSH
jgi:putative endonuclease